jgi:hypothetical protein
VADHAVTGVQVNLFCLDVETCAHFFEALGMRRAFVWPSTGPSVHIEVEAAGVRVGFDSITVANELANLNVTDPRERSSEVALWVTDVEYFFALAVRSGAHVLCPPMDSSDGRLRFAWVSDPENHQVKLLQPAESR